MGEAEERPECLPGPTRWRARGGGGQGVDREEPDGSKATLGAVESEGLGKGSGVLCLLDTFRVLAAVLTWASSSLLCVCVRGRAWEKEAGWCWGVCVWERGSG